MPYRRQFHLNYLKGDAYRSGKSFCLFWNLTISVVLRFTARKRVFAAHAEFISLKSVIIR